MMARFIDLGHPLHRTKHFFLSQLTNFWKLHTDITELCLTNDDLMTFVTNLLIKTRFVKHSVCSFNWLTVYWSRRDDYLALNVASCATLTQPLVSHSPQTSFHWAAIYLLIWPPGNFLFVPHLILARGSALWLATRKILRLKTNLSGLRDGQNPLY